MQLQDKDTCPLNKLPPSEIFVDGELKVRSGVKEEGFKGKHEVTSLLVEAETWTVESNCLSPVEAKYTSVESNCLSPFEKT